MDGRRVEVDVEAVLDTLEDCGLVDVVVARVDYTECFRPALLGRPNGCPEDSLAASSCVAGCLS